MRTEVLSLAFFGSIYAYQVYQNVFQDTGASENTVCPLSDQLFEGRVPSAVSCTYLCAASVPLGCQGASYDELGGMCYGCRNTPGSTTDVFGTQTGVVFYSLFGGIECDEPPAVDNARLFPGETSVGTKRRYTCISGYTNQAEYTLMSIRCLANGSWSTAMFRCKLGLPPYFYDFGPMVLKFAMFTSIYDVARHLCADHGALMKLNNAYKQAMIESFLSSAGASGDIYIQARRGQLDYVWRYDNGDVIPEENLFWAPGEPTNRTEDTCAVLMKNSTWKWGDELCTVENNFICQYNEHY